MRLWAQRSERRELRRKKESVEGKLEGGFWGAVAVGIGAGRRDLTGYSVDRCLVVAVLCLAVLVQGQGSHRGESLGGRGSRGSGDWPTGVGLVVLLFLVLDLSCNQRR